MGDFIASTTMQMANASKTEAPNYEGIWSATKDSLASLGNQKQDLIATARGDKKMIGEVGGFETENVLRQWESEMDKISDANVKALSQSGFAGSGVIQQEFDEAQKDLAEQRDYDMQAQQYEIMKADRQVDAKLQESLANIENQMNQYMTSFAGATGYEYSSERAPVEDIGCMGQVERDEGYNSLG